MIIKNYRNDLQILRGLAVIFVLFYHLKIPGFKNGYLGVDVFFVLSGYLISILLRKENIIFFYKKRLYRLIPAYLVTLIFSCFAVFIIANPVDSTQFFNRLIFNLFGLGNFVFWLENSYFENVAFRPLLHFWSLGIELQFYLIAPFIVLVLKKKKVYVIIFIIILSLFLSLIVLQVSPKTSFFMLPTRLWQFLIGFLAAELSDQLKINLRKNFYYFFFIIFLSIILFYPLKNNSTNIFFGHPANASLLISLITMFFCTVQLDKFIKRKNFLNKTLITLGNYSYSIYLTHFPVIVLVNYKVFDGTILGFNSIKSLVFIFLLTISFSYLIYNYIETLKYKKNINKIIFFLTISVIALYFILPPLKHLKYTTDQLKIYNAWEDRAYYRCGKIFRITQPWSKTCQIGKTNSEKKVLLIGDSHADSIKITLANTMSNHNISTYFTINNNPLKYLYKKNNIKNDIIKLNINYVIIHFNPGFYRKKENLKLLENFLKFLSVRSIKAIFIAPVPVYDEHIPKAMIKNISNSNLSKPYQDIIKYFKVSADFYEYIKLNKIKNSNIYYPHRILCPEHQCNYANNSTPYYFDYGHLTLSGSNTLIPMMNAIAISIK